MTRIVIIGAGFGGMGTAQTLMSTLKKSDNVEVIVLEKQTHFYHVVAAPRAYVDDEMAAKMFIPYNNAFTNPSVKLVRGMVTSISAEKKQVSYRAIDASDAAAADTLQVSFDYLVVATGSSHVSPIRPSGSEYSRAHTEAQLAQMRQHIGRADRILVIGGGAVGCEVAGEVAAKYPSKTVTLVHSRNKLISSQGLTDKFHSYLSESMKKLGIHVILGERLQERLTANSFEPRTMRTDKGTIVESDIQLVCCGFHPVAELISDMDASLVDDSGSVRVNQFMQLDDSKYSHIFALGDVSNASVQKRAAEAYHQGRYVAQQLVSLARNPKYTVSKPFPTRDTFSVTLSLGPHSGVTQLPVWGGCVFGDWLTWLAKGDMHTGFVWRMMRATPPTS